MIEFLFFSIDRRVAGVEMQYVDEVIHSPGLIPYLPISPHIKEMFVNRGRPIGIIDLSSFVSPNGKAKHNEVILLSSRDISFGIKINKIIQVRSVSKSKIVSPGDNTFLPEILLDSSCKAKQVMIPIISPAKILNHPEIEPLWNNMEIKP